MHTQSICSLVHTPMCALYHEYGLDLWWDRSGLVQSVGLEVSTVMRILRQDIIIVASLLCGKHCNCPR